EAGAGAPVAVAEDEEAADDGDQRREDPPRTEPGDGPHGIGQPAPAMGHDEEQQTGIEGGAPRVLPHPGEESADPPPDQPEGREPGECTARAWRVHPGGHYAAHRMSTASANHIGMATSLSPKLYWVSPPTRKPQVAIHAPTAVAQISGVAAPRMAAHPLRS